jgi:hypothetical protein
MYLIFWGIVGLRRGFNLIFLDKRTTLSAIAANVVAAWRRRGFHCRSNGRKG